MNIVLAHFFAFLCGLVFSASTASFYAETLNWTVSSGLLLLFLLATAALVLVLYTFNMLNVQTPTIPLGLSLLAGIKLIAFLMAPDSMWNWTMDAAAARNLQLAVISGVMLTPVAMGTLHALAYSRTNKA
ncbi:MAG: hypothetical protein DI628_08000 [Blastochloris viridis]|uniref:Uncharacterized protein n=1 Tax=Blastochloris viridis TaxID=1079 RepID=A0A6N4R0X1_BLAVI|nr:MAG: hypothetical protein DI628_08000 [Blastochloris viridis]